MRIGITGATGFIGSHLAEALLARGHRVRCLTRSSSNLRWLRALPVELARASLTSPEDLGAFARGTDAIVHTAGSKFAASREEFRRSNEALTSALLDAVERESPRTRRFVFLSSMAVTGPSPDGRPVGEEEPPRPLTSYGESKLRTELLIESRGARVPYTILRPPAVYGPRDRDLLPVFRMATLRFQPVIGRRHTFDMVYVKNLVHAIVLALESEAAANRTYHVADARPCTWAELGERLGEYLGKPPLTVAMPGRLVAAAGWVGQRAARWVGGEVKLNDQKVREMRVRAWRISCARARAEIGYEPPWDIAEAVAETFDWYRAHGWV
jgi:nucleoside-diphosphate-sugar epimerase